MRRSYVSVPLVEPFMFQTVPERLKHLAEADPEREAFVFYGFDLKREQVTRKQVYDVSIQLGKTLVNMGLQKGDTVAFCMNNSIEMIHANMAVITAGGVPFYLSTNLKDGSDIIKTMSVMQCKMLFIDISKENKNLQIVEKVWPSASNASPYVNSLRYIVLNGPDKVEGNCRLMLSNLIEDTKDASCQLPSLDPEDIMAYVVTSGSTGEPKKVAHTHFGMLNCTRKFAIRVGIRESSCYFNERQFSWAMGYPRSFLATGCTRIFIDTRMSLSGINIERLAEMIEKERCDVMYVPRYLAVDLIHNPGLSTKFRNVQSAILSGERILKTNIVLKQNTFKNIYVFYGCTESGAMACFDSDNIDDYDDGIIGSPIQGVEMKIVDDDGKTVEYGESGELCSRTPWRFVQYKGMESLFNEVVDEKSWFFTGDIAHFRRDGNIVVDGRKKEFVTIQTVKYFPWDIESALQNLPGVQSVIAVAVPDERLSSVFCACVVPKNGFTLTADDVNRYCDDLFLEEGTAGGLTIKPRYCLILDKLLLTSTGKIDRKGIALAAKERLRL